MLTLMLTFMLALCQHILTWTLALRAPESAEVSMAHHRSGAVFLLAVLCLLFAAHWCVISLCSSESNPREEELTRCVRVTVGFIFRTYFLGSSILWNILENPWTGLIELNFHMQELRLQVFCLSVFFFSTCLRSSIGALKLGVFSRNSYQWQRIAPLKNHGTIHIRTPGWRWCWTLPRFRSDRTSGLHGTEDVFSSSSVGLKLQETFWPVHGVTLSLNI